MNKTHHITVVDVESTCWRGNPPPGQHSDIIEIGVCRLDLRSLEPSDKRSIFVRPQRSSVSAFCTELTTITAADVADAPMLAEACAVLRRDFESKDAPWASYGDYDRRQFERCCKAADAGYPFGATHQNVKALLAAATGQRPCGMAQALERLGLPLLGTHHRGHDDAWNIARILGTILGAAREGLGQSAGR